MFKEYFVKMKEGIESDEYFLDLWFPRVSLITYWALNGMRIFKIQGIIRGSSFKYRVCNTGSCF